MSKKFGYSMFLATILIMVGFKVSLVFSEDNLLSANNRVSPKKYTDEVAIIWQEPLRENGSTIIPGWAPAKFGRLELRWIIDTEGEVRLVTLESLGAGEGPPLEKKIFLFIRDNGTTLLFQEWFSLLNENKPGTIRDIISVATKELFSVLPDRKLPAGSSLGKEIQGIQWGKKNQRNDVQYMPGKLTIVSGRRNIYWKKKAGRIPQLFSPAPQGAGNQQLAESRLYLWMDLAGETTVIFQEEYSKSSQGTIPYLWPLAVVQTTELLSGFKKIY